MELFDKAHLCICLFVYSPTKSQPYLRGYPAPRKGEICSARQTRSTKCSGAVIFSLSPFIFFCSARGLLSYFTDCDTRPLFASPPPPYTAAAARRRRTPPSSHHPPPPLPQHATAVTPESFADVPVCPYPRSYSSTIEQRISWLASCKSCCCRRFSRLVPHSNDQHRRLAIVVRRRRLCHRGGSRRSSKGRRRGFRVGEDGHREDDPALLLPR